MGIKISEGIIKVYVQDRGWRERIDLCTCFSWGAMWTLAKGEKSENQCLPEWSQKKQCSFLAVSRGGDLHNLSVLPGFLERHLPSYKARLIWDYKCVSRSSLKAAWKLSQSRSVEEAQTSLGFTRVDLSVNVFRCSGGRSRGQAPGIGWAGCELHL